MQGVQTSLRLGAIRVHELVDLRALTAHERAPLFGEHHEVSSRALHDGTLGPDVVGEHEIGGVTGQRTITALCPGGSHLPRAFGT